MLVPGMNVTDKYRVTSVLGRGGTSRVFLAENIQTGKRSAVKEVPDRFISEIDMLKRLSHSGLPKVEDTLEHEGMNLLFIEYIPGSSIGSVLREYGAQPIRTAVDWMIQLCEVLTYLHTRTPPIIYRDVKPSNLMLKPDGKIMLIDFGTAREYKSDGSDDTELLGTRGYAAPEQYGGFGQSDPRTDIYGIGATFYHILTGAKPGKPPFHFHSNLDFSTSDLDGAEKIIQKCTQISIKERYASCIELSCELRNIRRKLHHTRTSDFTEIIDRTRAAYIFDVNITIVSTNQTID